MTNILSIRVILEPTAYEVANHRVNQLKTTTYQVIANIMKLFIVMIFSSEDIYMRRKLSSKEPQVLSKHI